MAVCSVCGKGVHFGNNVSHANNKSNRMWKSNIKSVTPQLPASDHLPKFCSGTQNKPYPCLPRANPFFF